jgi:hypothetical protein
MDNLLRRISIALATSGRVRPSGPRPGVVPVAFFAVDAAAAPDLRAPNRRGVFSGLLEALHDSRRRQAAREIHRYRHLIQEPPTCRAMRSEILLNADSDPQSPSAPAASDPVEAHPDRRSTAPNSRDRTAHAEGYSPCP